MWLSLICYDTNVKKKNHKQTSSQTSQVTLSRGRLNPDIFLSIWIWQYTTALFPLREELQGLGLSHIVSCNCFLILKHQANWEKSIKRSLLTSPFPSNCTDCTFEQNYLWEHTKFRLHLIQKFTKASLGWVFPKLSQKPALEFTSQAVDLTSSLTHFTKASMIIIGDGTVWVTWSQGLHGNQPFKRSLSHCWYCIEFCFFNKSVILIKMQWNKKRMWNKRYKELKENNNSASFLHFPWTPNG